jgi:transposase-like protein
MNLIQISEKFPNEKKAVLFFEKKRWGKTIRCVYCGGTKISDHDWQYRRKCATCNKSFSVTVDTRLHHTRVPLQTWLFAISVITDAKKGMSALQLQRNLNISYPTAFKMYHKIRDLMSYETNQPDQLKGIVEIDETYIGGTPRRFNTNHRGKVRIKPHHPELDEKIQELKKQGVHFKRGKRTLKKYDYESKTGHGTNNIPVVGIVQRNGDVVAEVMKGVNFPKLKEMVKYYVEENKSVLISDQAQSYKKMETIIDHLAVNHNRYYSYKGVNTNSIESFWAIIKRGIMGQYHHVSIQHLPDYIAEFVFKYNNRKVDDMFETLVKAAICD